MGSQGFYISKYGKNLYGEHLSVTCTAATMSLLQSTVFCAATDQKILWENTNSTQMHGNTRHVAAQHLDL